VRVLDAAVRPFYRLNDRLQIVVADSLAQVIAELVEGALIATTSASAVLAGEGTISLTRSAWTKAAMTASTAAMTPSWPRIPLRP
jgi:hypothetical protein